MYSRAEQYRRRGIEAQRRAAHAMEPHIRQAFEQATHDWFALAEQVEWLDRHRHPAPEEKPEAASVGGLVLVLVDQVKACAPIRAIRCLAWEAAPADPE